MSLIDIGLSNLGLNNLQQQQKNNLCTDYYR